MELKKINWTNRCLLIGFLGNKQTINDENNEPKIKSKKEVSMKRKIRKES